MPVQVLVTILDEDGTATDVIIDVPLSTLPNWNGGGGSGEILST